MDFVHLHNHSEYSMLDSTAKVKQMVARAKELGMPALAITDHGNLHGAFTFYKECRSVGIKPIIGCEVYTTEQLDVRDKSVVRNHLILLAKDNTGYRNLCRIVSEASRHFYYKPLVNRAIIRQYHEGLVCLSACIKGEVPYAILQDGYESGRKIAEDFVSIFGKEDFYIEVQDHGLPQEKEVLPSLFALAKELGVKTVATNDIHYIDHEDAKAQEILLCIQTNSNIDSPKFRFDSDQFYFKTAEEMDGLFHDRDGCLSNTVEIADKCNIEIETGLDLAPHFPRVPEGETESSYLRKICERNLVEKYPADKLEAARARMDYELGVIEKMNYSGYFLIVWDFIRYARENGIAIGPGRGSAVGSSVCYLTGITMLEPMEYGLLFERFLNPERVSMPDIDSDIAFEDRKKIVQYMVDTYGEENSAQIATFGRENAKGAIRDVARVFGKPYEYGDSLAKMFPTDPKTTIASALEQSVDLRRRYEAESDTRRIIDFAQKIEGLPRQDGTHAAGLVICKQKLQDVIPVSLRDDGLHAQYAKDDVEEIGLLKMDLLGLKNLSVITSTLRAVKKNYGIDIDIDHIPMDDEDTMSMLRAGDTFGVFQMESAGITEIVTKIAPKEFRDLIPIVALYRPGPLGSGMVDDFISRCRGEEEISYVHPCLEPILKDTYGVILYQEQVMKVVQTMAGFSLGKADLVRRAMGKKKEKILKGLRGEFVQGCLNNGITQEKAEEVFELLLFFANYGFNKSHSAAYGYIAYQTAYLKAHYPKEYMASYMNVYINEKDKVKKTLMFCRRHHIRILPPDIMRSGLGFTATSDGILFGLRGIKQVGSAVGGNILRERSASPFANVTDFLFRVNVSKSDFHQLCFSGALDSIWSGDPLVLRGSCDKMFEVARKLKKHQEKDTGMESLFGPMIPSDILSVMKASDLVAVTSSESLREERDVLGFFVSRNPLDEIPAVVAWANNLETIMEKLPQESFERGFYAKVCGVPENLKFFVTKRGETMASFVLNYFSTDLPCVIFPGDLDKIVRAGGNIDKDIVVLKVQIGMRNGSPQGIVRDVCSKNIGDPVGSLQFGRKLAFEYIIDPAPEKTV